LTFSVILFAWICFMWRNSSHCQPPFFAMLCLAGNFNDMSTWATANETDLIHMISPWLLSFLIYLDLCINYRICPSVGWRIKLSSGHLLVFSVY
jgi:hypothetical protein